VERGHLFWLGDTGCIARLDDEGWSFVKVSGS